MEMFIREELMHQERLEAAGYRSPTWKVLRSLQSLLSETQLKGESAVMALPFFPNAGRGTVRFKAGGTSKDQLSSCGMAWMKRGGRNANVQFRHEKIGLCGAERDQ